MLGFEAENENPLKAENPINLAINGAFKSGSTWIRTKDPLLVRQMLWTSWAMLPIGDCKDRAGTQKSNTTSKKKQNICSTSDYQLNKINHKKIKYFLLQSIWLKEQISLRKLFYNPILKIA